MVWSLCSLYLLRYSEYEKNFYKQQTVYNLNIAGM